MPQPLFLQNIIACIWDFDKTLIPGYMQEPLFAHYKVEPKDFWQEVAALPELLSQKRSGNDCIRHGLPQSHFDLRPGGGFQRTEQCHLAQIGPANNILSGSAGFF